MSTAVFSFNSTSPSSGCDSVVEPPNNNAPKNAPTDLTKETTTVTQPSFATNSNTMNTETPTSIHASNDIKKIINTNNNNDISSSSPSSLCSQLITSSAKHHVNEINENNNNEDEDEDEDDKTIERENIMPLLIQQNDDNDQQEQQQEQEPKKENTTDDDDGCPNLIVNNTDQNNVVSENAMNVVLPSDERSNELLLTYDIPTTTTTIHTTTEHLHFEHSHSHHHAGLNNLGNTCYLNSALQMLFSIDSFVNQMIRYYHYNDDNLVGNMCVSRNMNMNIMEESNNDKTMDIDITNNNNDCTGNTCSSNPYNDNHNHDNLSNHDIDKQKHFPLHVALANLFHSMKINNHNHNNIPNPILTNQTTTTTISTKNQNTHLNRDEYIQQLKNVIDQLTPQFIGYYQQDAHEFLSTLIDFLHDEIVNYEKYYSQHETEGKRVEDEKQQQQFVQKEKQEEEEEKQQNDKNNEMQIGSEDETVCEEMNVGECTDTDTAINIATVTASYKETRWILENDVEKTMDHNIGYVMVHNNNNNGLRDDDKQSNKKARLTTAEDLKTDEFNNQNDDKEEKEDKRNDDNAKPGNDFNVMTKVPSFSQLKLEEISVLLHGHGNCNQDGNNCGNMIENHNEGGNYVKCHNVLPTQKLIGGRMANMNDFNPTSNVNTSPSSPFQFLQEVNNESNDKMSEEVEQHHTEYQQITYNIQPHHQDSEAAQHQHNSLSTEASTTVNINHDHPTTSCPALVDNFFTMEIRTCLICNSCNFKRSRQETFRHLSLDIGDADDEDVKNNSTDVASILSTISSLSQSHYERTLQEGLRKFFSSEKLELKCEKCFGESATQTKEITRLPKVLLLHLKRFVVDFSPDYTSVSYRKNRAAIDFDESLSLDLDDDQSGVLGEFLATDVNYPVTDDIDEGNMTLAKIKEINPDDDDDYEMVLNNEEEEEEEDFVDLGVMKQKYRIRSVVNHIGSSANCGHYTANALKLEKQGGHEHREWFKFNDDFVSRMCKVEAMGENSQKGAYMILYELE